MTTFSFRSSCHYLIIFFFLVLLGLASTSSSATFISYDIFEPPHGPGRSLLQKSESCPVDFENQNYTIITSKCKGPSYPPKMCCAALKEFACPFAGHISDLKTDCATTMFSYITLYGKYPPGLFASGCKEDNKQGLDCSKVEPPKPSPTSAATAASAPPLALAATVLLLSLHFF